MWRLHISAQKQYGGYGILDGVAYQKTRHLSSGGCLEKMHTRCVAIWSEKDGNIRGQGNFELNSEVSAMSGERFKKVERSVAKDKKIKDPAAVAASIGRKKYGKKKFQAMATAGRRRAAKSY